MSLNRLTKILDFTQTQRRRLTADVMTNPRKEYLTSYSNESIENVHLYF